MHLKYYGDNSKRLNGEFKTSNPRKFDWGEGDRGASVRIPTFTVSNKYSGYIEDRRPASNMDPYLVTALLADSTILNQTTMNEMLEQYKQWSEWRKTVNIEQ